MDRLSEKHAFSCIHELFEAQAERTPDAVAVRDELQSLTYSQLNRKANQLARYLLSEGVEPDQPVAICLTRSVEMVVATLAVLKAGGAYLPLDPDYPRQRLHFMIQDAAPRIVLTHAELRGLLPPATAEVLDVSAALKGTSAYVTENLPVSDLRLTAANLVYVIYTSGSTGTPKGTAMPHRAMVNLVEWHRATFPPGEGKRTLQFAALGFDVAFQEIFSTLCTGGTLVLLGEWIRRDARALLEFLRERQIERLFLPPLMLHSLAQCCVSNDDLPRALEEVITAGEQLRITPEVASFFAHLPRCRLHNHYGPTETHVVTALTLDGDPSAWPAQPSIGMPIANTQIHILDDARRPVPDGSIGEIWIGGANVAHGYLGRSELTARRFVPDPFRTEAGAQLYRTGDQGRRKPDGTIEYLGRQDDQVKIRGFRVELGEIEARLLTHQSIKEAAVVAREDALGMRRLVAYLIARGEQEPDTDALRAHLKSALPDYMVPAAFVVLDRFPTTPSGKLDRRALPAPDARAYATQEYDPPRGEVEKLLARSWRELLGLERVGRNDNFFALGGDSLLMVSVMEKLRAAGITVSAKDAYRQPTLAALAATLTESRIDEGTGPDAGSPLMTLAPADIEYIARSVPGGASNLQDIYPLAPLQEGILFHHLLDADRGNTYVVPLLLSLESRARVGELVDALQKVIDRHDALRSAVFWERVSSPMQVVCRRASLRIEERTLERTRDEREQLDQWLRPQALRLELDRPPLLDLLVFGSAATARCYAILRVHHLLCDHESLELVLAEVSAMLDGRASTLPQPAPYRRHVAEALRGARTHDSKAFFASRLSKIDEPTLAFGLSDVRGDADRIERSVEPLEPALAARIRQQARRARVGAATLFHAAWALVVARASGRGDVVFGSLLAGRLQVDASARQTVGMFINTLPLRIPVDGLSVAELVRQTHDELGEILQHEHASLAMAQKCSGLSGAEPLFNTLLNCRHATPHQAREVVRLGPGVDILELKEWTNYPISVAVDDDGSGFTMEARTDRRIRPQRILGYLGTAMASLVSALESARDAPTRSLSVLPEHELRQVLHEFNATAAELPAERLIHRLFEQQVARTPHAPAVECGGRSMTYAELNGRANRLARALRNEGLGSDRLAAICLERSIELVIAILGVLKAGGAYVPLDPDNPVERLKHILADAKPLVLLTRAGLIGRLPQTCAKVVALDDAAARIAQHAGDDLDSLAAPVEPHHLAYVIYTSGSTGRPKGVMIEHRNIVNYTWHVLRQFDVAAGQGSLICSSFSFDLMLTGLYAPLLCGRIVHLCPEERGAADLPDRLGALRNIAPLKLTPSHVALLEPSLRAGDLAGCVRTLVLGGEPLHAETVQLWKRFAPGTRVFNHYGPTETTVGCVAGEASGTESGPVPIGRPIANTQIHILDASLQPVPIGAIGELHVGGEGVARGYLNRPELTTERFIVAAIAGQPAGRLYRTGDRARWREDGSIEFVGRSDQQVKVRGYRVELGEIESQLMRHPGVERAAVVVSNCAPGDQRLIAYFTSYAGGRPSPEDLRTHLKAAVPEYMLPAAFIALSEIPRTPNGKLDRGALPAPDYSEPGVARGEEPQGPTEQALAVIWKEVLRLERVGRDQDFFESGGHSLLAMQVIARIRATFDIDLELRALFNSPTLWQLAERVDAAARTEREEMQALLERVAAMPESEAQELVHRLTAGGR